MDLGELSTLIERARGGDDDALDKIIETIRPQLVRRAKYELDSKVYARFDPSDVAQVTCLEIHRDFDAFRGSSKREFVAWVKRILQHNVANTIRRHVQTEKRSLKNEKSLNAPAAEGLALIDFLFAPATSSPSARLARTEQFSEVENAFHQLPKDQAEAVRLRHLEGMTLKELAEHFDRSEVAVAGLLKRGMRALRGLLNEDESIDGTPAPND